MSHKTLSRLPFYVFLAIIAITGLVFLAAGLAMNGGFGRAWEILLAVRSPFGEADALGVALSALGYIAVPTVIGLAVADGITRFTRRRLITSDSARSEIREVVQEELADESDSGSKEDL